MKFLSYLALLETCRSYILVPQSRVLFGRSDARFFPLRLPSAPITHRRLQPRPSFLCGIASNNQVKSEASDDKPVASTGVKPELSRVINISSLGSSASGAAMCRIRAKAQERAALAKRFEIAEINDLSGELTIEKTSEYIYTVRGTLNATISEMDDAPVVAICAPITSRLLAPLPNDVYNSLKHRGELPEYDEEIPSSGDIDMGEILAQHLSIEYSMMYQEPDEADLKDFMSPIGL